jgi:hypothetical protein
MTFLAVIPAAAPAVQRYASTTGSGDPTACIALAPCSLPDALSNGYLSGGDEIILSPGIYTVSSELAVTKAIHVHGTGAAAATVVESNGFGNGVAINHMGAYLSDFELRHNTGAGYGARVVAGNLERMIVRSNVDNGCELTAGLIRDSVCQTNAASKSGLSVNLGGSGTYTMSLRNVTAIGTATNSSGINVYADGSVDVTLVGKSVIARGVWKDVWAASIDTAKVAVNLEHSNYETTGLGGTSVRTITDPSTNANQTTAPLFVDAPAGDYRQAAGSPTIDAGQSDIFSGTADFERQARPSGAANDIGADEYLAPPAPGGPSGADTTPPAGKIVKKPARRTSRRKASFSFSSNEPGSTYLCKLDRGKYRACKSGFSKRVMPGKACSACRRGRSGRQQGRDAGPLALACHPPLTGSGRRDRADCRSVGFTHA